MFTVTLYNTRSGKKEQFITQTDSDVRIYVCGVTPYDHTHIGHGRCYVTFDILYRLLRSLGYDVFYTRNITDIDDKIINRARKEYGDVSAYTRIADYYIETFHQDMAYLGCLVPTYEPRVTHSIIPIIGAIQDLIDAGCAYESNGNVYFDINQYKQYGSLSGQKPSEMQTSVRGDAQQDRRNPLDFALWKRDDSQASFQSPWGNGRPGWHIECSVLAHETLGTPIDIHGGGLDLLFPHHENEMAQTACWQHYPLARYWMHNAFVQVDQEKMAKSEGNYYTLQQLFDEYDPMVVRFMVLRHHYRTPLDFSRQELDEAKKAYMKLCRTFADVEKLVHISPKTERITQLYEYLCDDVNVPGMLGQIFKHLDAIKNDEYEASAVRTILTDICGLTLEMPADPDITIPDDVQQMMREREKARKARDWQKADELRHQIESRGFQVQDRPLHEIDTEE